MIGLTIIIIAVFGLTHSTLIITNPSITTFPDNSIPYFYANFGQVSYGKTLSFNLQFIDGGICGDSKSYPKITKPTYILVQTYQNQTCSFTKRAKVAQEMGAKGLIIASPIVDRAQGNVIMADDGNGRKIHITCLFIKTADLKSLEQLNKIEITANFPVPKANISTVHLFLSSSKRSTYTFLRKFEKQYQNLRKYVNLLPIYHTVQCKGCQNDDCYLDSCCYDYQSQQTGVGRRILRQEMIQYFIFLQNGVDTWFEYMNLFDEYCGDWNAIVSCHQKIRDSVQFDSFGLKYQTPFQFWKSTEKQIGFDNFPEVAINNMVYRGNLDVNGIVLAICQSLITPPKYCQEKFSKTPVQKPNKHKHVTIIIFSTMLALFGFTVLAVCCYKKCIRSELTKDMSSRVGEIIADYANHVSAQKKKKEERLAETFQEEL